MSSIVQMMHNFIINFTNYQSIVQLIITNQHVFHHGSMFVQKWDFSMDDVLIKNVHYTDE